MKHLFAIAIFTAALLTGAHAQTMVITEWQYNGSEFIEFTNISTMNIDMTGWSYSDSARSPGDVDLSAFGTVAPGQSVILAEVTAAEFRFEWSLPLSVVVIGENTFNLGRSDEINIYDASNNLVDRLTYGDQTFSGTIRTDVASGNTAPANYGTNNVFAWELSFAGDSYGSSMSQSGFFGNPGIAAIPEPSAFALVALAAGCFFMRRKRIDGRLPGQA